MCKFRKRREKETGRYLPAQESLTRVYTLTAMHEKSCSVGIIINQSLLAQHDFRLLRVAKALAMTKKMICPRFIVFIGQRFALSALARNDEKDDL
jgi:hypothetical protein